MQRKYDPLTRTLHWLVALGVLTMIGLGISFGYLSGEQKNTAIFIHKSLAMTLLMLMILRVVWRITFGSQPQYDPPLPRWQVVGAHSIHHLLYLLIFIMLFSGWLMSSWNGYPVPFWGIANLALPLSYNSLYASIAYDIHEICAWIIGGIIGLHTLIALWHLSRRDGVIDRMI